MKTALIREFQLPRVSRATAVKMTKAANTILRILAPMSCCRRRRIVKAVMILTQGKCCE